MGVSGTPNPVIQVSHIRKNYGATAAVADVSFEVSEGEVYLRGIAPRGNQERRRAVGSYGRRRRLGCRFCGLHGAFSEGVPLGIVRVQGIAFE